VGKEQFVKLQQGDQSVREYLKQFSYLSQFALEYVSTDDDKKFWFSCGLDMGLQKLLIIHPNASYDESVSIAINAEYYDHLGKEAKNRKLEESSSSNIPYQRIVFKTVHHFPYLTPQQQTPQ
jgi:hypothetical protein